MLTSLFLSLSILILTYFFKKMLTFMQKFIILILIRNESVLNLGGIGR